VNDSSGRRGGVRPRWTAAMVAALVLAGLAVVACDGQGSAGPGTSSGQNMAVVLDSYAACMRGHGVPNFYFTHPVAPPSAPPPGTFVLGYRGWFAEAASGPRFRSAQKACLRLLPFGKVQGAETHQEFLDALKTAECMRSHGYPNWPDPNPDVGGVGVPNGVDTRSTQFQAAAKTCGQPVPPGG
jgi:hypothetical protein